MNEQNDELKARVERLLTRYEEVLNMLHEYKGNIGWPMQDVTLFEETPAQSLAAHNREIEMATIERCAIVGDRIIIMDELLPPNTTVGDQIRNLSTAYSEGDDDSAS